MAKQQQKMHRLALTQNTIILLQPQGTLRVQIPLRRSIFDTTYDKVRQWPAVGQWFSLVSSTNKTDRNDITEILLKVVLNTITLTCTQEHY